VVPIWGSIIKIGPDVNGYIRQDMGLTSYVLVSSTPFYRFDSIPWMRYVLIGSTFVILILWIVYLSRFDKRRKSVEIYYNMDEEATQLYEKFLSSFKQFMSSKKIWEVHSSQKSLDQKYTSGASKVITRSDLSGISRHKLPNKYFITNVEVPYIGLKRLSFYFFPERLVIKKGKKFAALSYKNLVIESSVSNMTETDPLPKDANVIEYTWQYPNKSGGPDKRFKNNPQIPICEYSKYHFYSDSGVSELIQTSKTGAMDAFVKDVQQIAQLQ